MRNTASTLRRLAVGFCLCLFALLAVPAVSAQETTGAIEGTVKDPSGATISGASVILTGEKLIGSKVLETDGSGYYHFVNLTPGIYTISVKSKGFVEIKRENIQVSVGRSLSLDLALAVGSEQTVIDVTSAVPQIDVTSSKSQTIVTRDQLDYTPRGRSFQSVIAFAPGARNEPLQGGFQIDGGATAENSYLINGMETSSMQNGKSVANAPFEFIQEVQVKTGGIEAENGGALGGVVNAVTKSGSNTFHGSLFTYYEGDPMDALSNGPFTTSSTTSTTTQAVTLRNDPAAPYCPYGTTTAACKNVAPRSDYAVQFYTPKKDHYRYVQPGFEGGGAILKDRLWYFVGLAPQFTTARRTVDFGVNSSGVRQFNFSEQTYYSVVRLDYKVSERIRVFGQYQYAYDRQTGNTWPNPDDRYGLVNATIGNPVDSYQGAIGSVAPNNVKTAGADITLTPNLVFTSRVGNFYQNYGDRGLPAGDRMLWAATSLTTTSSLSGTSLGTAYANGVKTNGSYNISPNLGYQAQVNSRTTLNEDLAWFKKGFFGAHNLKGGYQFQHLYTNQNQVFTNTLMRIGYATQWSTSTTVGATNCATIAAQNQAAYGSAGGSSSACQGNWGYLNVRDGNEIVGKASSNNHGFYVQDNWQIARGFTANVGVRFEHEYLPSFNQYGSGIDFGWGSKVAPRLGAAWDVFQNGKLKVQGSYSVFYDVMKLNLAIGSFGGNYWNDCVYALDSPDWTAFHPTKNASGHYCPNGGSSTQAVWSGGSTPSGLRFIENVNYRIPSNDPSQGAAVDPGLKPYREHEANLGISSQISRTIAFESRYTRRRLDSVIEDIGYVTPNGEAFIIGNPGMGVVAGGSTSSCPGCKYQPRGERNYDAVEFRITKMTANHWYGQFAYTYSRLRGNYSGLTSTDISDAGGARANPNNNRAFDEPYLQFDAHGQTTNGLLATDRPNSFKAYGYYQVTLLKRHSFSIGGFEQASSGTPLSTYIDVNGSAGSYPVYPEKRGTWVDITKDPATGNWIFGNNRVRRTPWYIQTDASVIDEFALSDAHEKWKLGFEANVTNLLNAKAATLYQSRANASGSSGNYFLFAGTTANNPNYALLESAYDWKGIANSTASGTRGPLTLSNQYGLPSNFQTGRSIRLKVKFMF